MKLKVSYATKEKKYHGEHTYSHVYKTIEVYPQMILRRPCGSGASSNRYYYEAVFKAPDDAEFIHNGVVNSPINRKLNKQFDPKKIHFDGRIAVMQKGH